MYKYHTDSITICFYIKLNMIHINVSNLLTHLASFPCLSVNSPSVRNLFQLPAIYLLVLFQCTLIANSELLTYILYVLSCGTQLCQPKNSAFAFNLTDFNFQSYLGQYLFSPPSSMRFIHTFVVLLDYIGSFILKNSFLSCFILAIRFINTFWLWYV